MEDIDKYFVDENIDMTYPPEPKYLAGGKYRLDMSSYKIGTPEDHYWNFTRAKIYLDETNELLFDVKRNYSTFYATYFRHNNGNEYIVCGRNYHGGYSVLDLTNRKEYCHNPVQEYEYQQFFCWVRPEYNPSDNTLEVEGCYWGAPFEIVTYDFSDPSVLPLREIERHEIEDKPYDNDDDDDEEEEDDS